MGTYDSSRVLGETTVGFCLFTKKPAPIATVVGIGAGFVVSACAEDEMGA